MASTTNPLYRARKVVAMVAISETETENSMLCYVNAMLCYVMLMLCYVNVI